MCCTELVLPLERQNLIENLGFVMNNTNNLKIIKKVCSCLRTIMENNCKDLIEIKLKLIRTKLWTELEDFSMNYQTTNNDKNCHLLWKQA